MTTAGDIASFLEETKSKGEQLPATQQQLFDLNLVLIDNYDSYTYNLHHYLASMCVSPPKVVANNAYESWHDLIVNQSPSSPAVDGIILSPGPGRPPHDTGICLEAIESNPNLPILGVCLGHQALGYVYNATVALAPHGPVHGQTSHIQWAPTLNGSQSNRLFFNLPSPTFPVVRYHSLVVNIPSYVNHGSENEIIPTAWTEDGTNMALQHATRPHFGVQFHPESIGTGEAGYQLLRNFVTICQEEKEQKRSKKDIRNMAVEGIILSQKNNVIANYIRSSSSAQTILRNNKLTIKRNGANGISYGPKTQDLQTTEQTAASSPYRILIHKVPLSKSPSSSLLPEQVFEALFHKNRKNGDEKMHVFWLDSSSSSRAESNDVTVSAGPRFSIMGSDDGPLSERIEYYIGDDLKNSDLYVNGILQHGKRKDRCDILSYLRQRMNQGGAPKEVYLVDSFSPSGTDTNTLSEANAQLPFDYRGGFVGYLGYEVRHDTARLLLEQEGCNGGSLFDPNGHKGTSSNTEQAPKPLGAPTAAFIFCDQSLLYDHHEDEWYLVGVGSSRDVANKSVLDWMRSAVQRLEQLKASSSNEVANSCLKSQSTSLNLQTTSANFVPNRSKAQYQSDIDRCHEEIRNGESYELCLTNQLEAKVAKTEKTQPFALYQSLRRRNPAPFAGFFHVPDKVSICCSSPERFLSIYRRCGSQASFNGKKRSHLSQDDDEQRVHGELFRPPTCAAMHGASTGDTNRESTTQEHFLFVETKPIKGTCARPPPHWPADSRIAEDERRAKELRESVKNRAENLMIVDLLRNDLSRVCQVGSVHVAKLMHIESYATVHQMVSTVRGTIDVSATSNGSAEKRQSIAAAAVDVLTACFPGGSMTGAPKLRSMEILDGLEEGVPRGPYSGSLGYISLNGCMDMNIIIRSAILTPSRNNTWNVSVGAGGAVTALSEPQDEYDEMMLKARAVVEAVEEWAASVHSTSRDEPVKYSDSNKSQRFGLSSNTER